MIRKIATVAAASSVQASFNVDFEKYLSGESPVDYEVFGKMWLQFESEFTSPMAKKNSFFERQSNFQDKVQEVIAHNSDPTSTWKKGINEFSDMTDAEFNEYYQISTGLRDPQHCSATSQRMSVAKNGERAAAWDWRDHNGVSPVKNQGHCGSCWTFSTVGALEAHTMIKYDGAFSPLSEQQLVDCAGDFDNHGCSGGLPSHAFEYIKAAGGISTEDAYPYFAADKNCTVNPDTFSIEVVGGSVNITEGDEEDLANAIFAHGPVSIAFEVVGNFRDYKTGVYVSDTCKNGSSDVNHAVLAVGYGVEDDVPYWLIKNSWGAAWGDEGFFKMKRGVNMCGVAQCNSFPQGVNSISHKHFRNHPSSGLFLQQ